MSGTEMHPELVGVDIALGAVARVARDDQVRDVSRAVRVDVIVGRAVRCTVRTPPDRLSTPRAQIAVTGPDGAFERLAVLGLVEPVASLVLCAALADLGGRRVVVPPVVELPAVRRCPPQPAGDQLAGGLFGSTAS